MGRIVETLLGGVIDYAGMFPPAALDLDTAQANYERYRRGPQGWLLGRFVVRVADLERAGAIPRLSVVVDREIPALPDTVESLETTWGGLPAIAGLEVYHEIPLDRRPIPDRAKIRLGGERVASAESLARFLVDARVPFKATAGLH
ncbi:MAG: hypothetical protein ACRD96_14640, partial [Bryobacteraceae bacterium]